mmetsp:Transcript_19993/g.49993  ORF Transcript_19993/g.49993 Transcript_19993/m.49993 type:complete len:402 (+) Transcript_19993:36-1241(+)
MGKDGGFLTPKAIGNRIKAKGLTKLRWYCQLCQKACRDENGFKCHQMSEAHLRQVRVFAENPDTFVDDYSVEFEQSFMEILRRKGEHVRSRATAIYSEVIADRHHIHMNSTKWLTLTEFVKYLGKEGKGAVDQDEEGKWYVRYINRDPEAEKRKEALLKKEKMDLDDAERAARMVEKQIKNAQKALPAQQPTVAPQELVRKEGEKMAMSLSATTAAAVQPVAKNAFGEDDEDAGGSVSSSMKKDGAKGGGSKAGEKRKLTAAEEIMMSEKKHKERKMETEKEEEAAADKDHWLHKGIVVKVVHKKVGDGKYYKKKGVVKEVHDTYIGEVKMIDTGHVLKLDQEHLETVIPSVDGEVLVVNGRYRGQVGILLGLNEKEFAARIRLEKGGEKPLPYEHVCKLA